MSKKRIIRFSYHMWINVEGATEKRPCLLLERILMDIYKCFELEGLPSSAT